MVSINNICKASFLFISLFIISCSSSTNSISPEESSMHKDVHFGFDYNEFKVDSGVIEKNQGLSNILPNYGVQSASIFSIAQNFKDIFDVRKIRTGDHYYMLTKDDSTHHEKYFIYEKDKIDYIVINLSDTVDVQLKHKPVEVNEKKASGIIETSLWDVFIKQGLHPSLFAEVLSKYQWSIDFYGAQKGDYFKVLYEEKSVEGDIVGTGDIKAVLFHHSGIDYYAFKHTYDDDVVSYYDENGGSMKRVLLSAPLKYKRISSRFSNSRLHPIYRVYRPHHGVDYAAPTGTPVHSTGAGRVTFVGRAGGAGKMIKIKHDNGRVLTKYLHLHRYTPGIKKGVHVSQGQKIGEVGSTGASTGPHLDYRVYINGKAVDPLGIEIPREESLKGELLASYLEKIKEVKSQLDSIQLKDSEPIISSL